MSFCAAVIKSALFLGLIIGLCGTGCGEGHEGSSVLHPKDQATAFALTEDGDIKRTRHAPILDGIPDSVWNIASPSTVRHPIRGALNSDSDLAASWRGLWDAEYLYVLAEVKDDTLVGDSPYAWEDDSIEIYIDGDHSRGTSYDGHNDYQLVFRPSDGVHLGARSAGNITGVAYAYSHSAGHYALEARIPWAILGVPAAARHQVGLDVHVNDDDDGGERDCKMSTYAVADDAWTNPSLFGSVTLSDDVPPVVGDILELNAPVQIDGNVDTEWNRIPYKTADKVLRGSTNGAGDLEGKWRALWDGRYLYIFANVIDDQFRSDSPYPWEDDSVEVYIDGDGSRGFEYDSVNDFQYVFRRNDSTVHVGSRSLARTEGITFSIVPAANGYTFEARIPWATIGSVATPGHVMGLDIHINDDDDGGERDTKLSTFAATDDAWSSPRTFGAVTLGTVLASDKGRLQGRVLDGLTQQPLPGAVIKLQACPTCEVTTVVADASGSFAFNGCDQPVAMTPSNGAEALRVEASRPNYAAREVFRKIDWASGGGLGACQTETLDVRLFPAGSQDTDGDGLCDAEEAARSLNAQRSDTDGDSLQDRWEVYGHDYVDLPLAGANPARKTVLVECSYMQGRRPPAQALTAAMQTYSAAPVRNHDGSRGIDLLVEVTDEVPFDENLSPVWIEFNAIKRQYFSTHRARTYHYCVVGNYYSSGYSSGVSFGIGAQDFIVTLGTSTSNIEWMTGTFLHELGHNLGLSHGGMDNLNYKPNYLSVMSYAYQFSGLIIDGTAGHYDYSHAVLAPLDEGNLDESWGLSRADGGDPSFLSRHTIIHFANGATVQSSMPNLQVDWNMDGVISSGVAIDINRDGLLGTLYSSNDWGSLAFDGGGYIGGAPNSAQALQTTPQLIECASVPNAPTATRMRP